MKQQPIPKGVRSQFPCGQQEDRRSFKGSLRAARFFSSTYVRHLFLIS